MSLLLLLLSHLGWWPLAVLFCLLLHVLLACRKRTLKKEDQVSKQVDTVSQKKEKIPGNLFAKPPLIHIVKNIAYASNDWH